MFSFALVVLKGVYHWKLFISFPVDFSKWKDRRGHMGKVSHLVRKIIVLVVCQTMVSPCEGPFDHPPAYFLGGPMSKPSGTQHISFLFLSFLGGDVNISSPASYSK